MLVNFVWREDIFPPTVFNFRLFLVLGNRTKPNLDDLHLAFQDTGVAVHELENYVAQVDPVPFIHPFTTYPRCKPCRLQHPSKGEFVDRADFYSEHLPPLPKVCEEPKGSVCLLSLP